MTIVVPDVGATALLDDLLEEATTWFHLYVNPVALGEGTVLEDFEEAPWPGYAPLQVTTWTPSFLENSRAVSIADPQQWVLAAAGGPWQVYGYFVTDGKNGPLLWAEANPQGPVVMEAAGDQVLILPRLTLRQDPEPG